MLRACPHNGFSELTQIDTFYNGLNEQDQDSLNAAMGGNLLSKTTREALKIIKNKSKVRYSRSKSNVSRVNTNSRDSASKTDDRIDKLADQISNLVKIVNKQVITPASAKAVEKTCVICGGAHAYYDCIATDSNRPCVCAATGTLSSNTIPNPKGEMKVVTTRSSLAYEGPPIPTNSFLEKLLEKLGDHDKFLMPLSIWKKLSLLELTPTRMTLELADRSITRPKGVAKNVFVKVGKFHFPTNFVVVDFEVDPRIPLILGRSFLRTGRALIDVYGEEITLRMSLTLLVRNLFKMCLIFSIIPRVAILLWFLILHFLKKPRVNPVRSQLSNLLHLHLLPLDKGGILYLEKLLNDDPFQLPPMDLKQAEETKVKSLIEEPPELELKELPYHLEYAFLEESDKLPVIIAKDLKDVEKEALIKVNPIHCVPKKGGMTVVANENNELIPTSLVTGWRVCIDYRKLNDATQKDHFPLPFMDQMMERLARNKFYFFLDGFSGIEVVRAKVNVIANLPHWTTVKGVRSFLGHAERTVGENRASWSDKLDDALWAFRTAFKTPIGCTPYKLTAGDHQKLQLNELNELRDQAYENSLIFKERTKKLHDSKIKNRIFNVGDQVLLFNSRLKIFSGKLKTRWSGPFTITQVFPYGTVELSQPNGPNFKVNGHRVKHYFGGDIPSKVVSDLHTIPKDK
nr:reverse transcriptase domain-containing protein [Tanacetum cinerariifolium]